MKLGSGSFQAGSCRNKSFHRLSRPCRLRCSARLEPSIQSVLQECAYVHEAVSSVGPVPQAVSACWSDAWALRVEEASAQPLALQLDDSELCEVVLVGVNHRDPANLAFILEVAQATQPDALALEARGSFLDTYRQLTAALPPQLLERVAWMPLTAGLQAAMDHISLDDRLEWHAALSDANDRMAAAAAAAGQQRADPTSAAREPWPPQQQVGPPAAAAAAAYRSSALSPSALREALLLGGGPHDLALSDKVAAVVVANELDVPLHGLELDDPAAYAALLSGPLVGRSSRSRSMEEVAARSHDGGIAHGSGSAGAAGQGRGQQQQQQQQQQVQQLGQGAAASEDLAAAQEALVWRHVEEYRPELAVAFREWMDAAAAQLRAADGGDGEVLAQLVVSALSGLMPQCLPPAPHRRLTAATDRLFMPGAAAAAAAPGPAGGGSAAGAQRGGRGEGAAAARGNALAAAGAQQYAQLTELREAHFLQRLRAIAASGGPGGRRCTRVLAVVGRSHADRLLLASCWQQ
ncbi:hypothetical protein HXX76_006208 [Chlamydomonas incerta]|uniref:Uncharacterized protein n=1 Tax=Chlamydomonas incerta TaxID=51695 RepID=A0A835TD86_CHLIN|nr:hypothetical protein HXX76_006208 [Chlamydomonas incerta]|eukprot:KAG2436680.1 hypothetical protein HXX76_006208 [Chlamydomonas incerta]